MNEKQLKKIFARDNVKFAYLFGSRATGKGLVGGSDFDIAVFIGKGTPRSRLSLRLKMHHDIQELFAPHSVDLLILDDIHSATLLFSITSGGRLLYEKDISKRIDFELHAMNEYHDFVPFLKIYNEAYMAKV